MLLLIMNYFYIYMILYIIYLLLSRFLKNQKIIKIISKYGTYIITQIIIKYLGYCIFSLFFLFTYFTIVNKYLFIIYYIHI